MCIYTFGFPVIVIEALLHLLRPTTVMRQVKGHPFQLMISPNNVDPGTPHTSPREDIVIIGGTLEEPARKPLMQHR